MVELHNSITKSEKSEAESKQTDDVLRHEKQFLDSIVNSLPVVFYMFDDHSNLVRWNRKLEQVTGYTADELLYMHGPDFFDGDDKTLIASRMQQVFEKGGSEAEAHFVTKRGEKIPYYFTGSRVIVDERAYLLGLGIDITAQKKVEKELTTIGMELSIGLFEVFEALKRISSGDPGVRVSEESEIELISKLKHMVNMTAENIGEIVDQSHEFAMGIAEHFDVLHKVSKGELDARISENSQEELLKALGRVTNEMIMSISSEMTERKRKEETIEKLRLERELILNSEGEGVFGLDIHGNHTFVNPSAAQMLGYTVNELIGEHNHTICHHTKADGSLYPEEECSIYKVLKSGSRSHKRDEIFWRKDGTSFPVSYIATPIKEGSNVVGAVVTFLDITESKIMEEELKKLATTDKLTGALNRTKFGEIIGREIKRFKSYNQRLSMILFDIDHFKEVNDRYGHNTGDSILKTIADIVQKSIREIDYFIRWGGEEFVILSPQTQSDEAYALAERIREVIENQPFDYVGEVTASFGVTEFKVEDTGDTFIKRADDAMYEAKKKGRNRVVLSV